MSRMVDADYIGLGYEDEDEDKYTNNTTSDTTSAMGTVDVAVTKADTKNNTSTATATKKEPISAKDVINRIASGAFEGSGLAGAGRLGTALLSTIAPDRIEDPYKDVVGIDDAVEKGSDLADVLLLPLQGVRGAAQGAITGAAYRGSGLEDYLTDESTPGAVKATPYLLAGLSMAAGTLNKNAIKNAIKVAAKKLLDKDSADAAKKSLDKVPDTTLATIPDALSKVIPESIKRQYPKKMKTVPGSEYTVDGVTYETLYNPLYEDLRKHLSTMSSDGAQEVLSAYKKKIGEEIIDASDLDVKRTLREGASSIPKTTTLREVLVSSAGEDAKTNPVVVADRIILESYDPLTGTIDLNKFKKNFSKYAQPIIKKEYQERLAQPILEAENAAVDSTWYEKLNKLEELYNLVSVLPKDKPYKQEILRDIAKEAGMLVLTQGGYAPVTGLNIARKAFMPRLSINPASVSAYLDLIGVGGYKIPQDTMSQFLRMAGYRVGSMSLDPGAKESLITKAAPDITSDLIEQFDEKSKQNQQ